MNKNIQYLIDKANLGDKKALESIIIEIQDLVYNLSLKMLLFPEDAKDATQEILIKIITHLHTYKNKSEFKTWVYRVSTNYLLTEKGKKAKEFAMSFEDYEDLIDLGQSDIVRYSKNEGVLSLLEEEVKVSCTQGLLLCLNEEDRIVYILSEILDFNGVEGSLIMGITAENFRKKLSRSRAKIRNFLSEKCGLMDAKNPCKCSNKIDFLINKQIINPKDLRFAQFSNRSIELVQKITDLEKSKTIFSSIPNFSTPGIILKEIKQTLKLD